MGLRIAIADCGMGNLFSVAQALRAVGCAAEVTQDPLVVRSADGVVLPGVGAFGDAMEALTRLGLDQAILESASLGRPIFGVCLGMQLLLTESEEFGLHHGLGLIRGRVRRLENPRWGDRLLKVPHVGWNEIVPAKGDGREWGDPLLEGVAHSEYMYFVHSYHAQPEDSSSVTAVTHYGGLRVCASLRRSNVFGCQFHPERSGRAGLRIYQNFANLVEREARNRVS